MPVSNAACRGLEGQFRPDCVTIEGTASRLTPGRPETCGGLETTRKNPKMTGTTRTPR